MKMGRPIVYYTEIKLGDCVLRARMTEYMSYDRYRWNAQHVSLDYEMHLFLDGVTKIKIGDREQLLQAGCCVILPPNTLHAGESKTERYDRLSIHFDVEGKKLKKIFREAIGDYVLISINENIRHLARELLDGITSREPYAREIRSAQMQQLILQLLRQAGIVAKSESVACEKEEKQERRNLVEEFFWDGLYYGMERKDLADILQLSERQTLRFLKENYGMTFEEKLDQFRKENSAWQLLETDRSMQEIMERLRFKSLSAFYKAFRKWYGMPPGEYRKKYKY